MPFDPEVLARLERFAARPVAFRCRPDNRFAGGHPNRPANQRPSPNDRVVLSARHKLGPPADAPSLSLLRSHLGALTDGFARCVAAHDGVRLYVDAFTDLCAVEVLPVREWEEATREMRVWVDDVPPEHDPAHLGDGVAFGKIPDFAVYLAVARHETYAGQVFLVRPDGPYGPPLAPDLAGTLDRLIGDPIDVLRSILGDRFRLADRSGWCWVPEAVVPTDGII